MTLPAGAREVAVEHDVMIPMRDGIRLAADIYRPATDGLAISEPGPVILERTPYDKAGTALSDVTLQDRKPFPKPDIARYFASHGYVVVMQDCRGRYRSEGQFRKYVNEAEDGYDTVEWLARQPWCDGRVATMGLSYCAHVQSALACLAPPALASQFLESGGFSSAYHGGIRQGGAFELKQATWAYKHALLSPETRRNPARRAQLESQDIRAWFRQMPWRRGHSPVSAAPEYEDYLFEQWEQGEFSDYWRKLGLFAQGHYDAYADVPMVHMSSWYDPYARTATDNFVGLSRRKHSAVHLVMGPWTHGRRSETFAGDVEFGAAATLDGQLGDSFYELRRRWFDYALRRSSENPLGRGRVALFVMGGGSGRRNAAGRLEHGGCWRWADDWPLPGTQYASLYLHEGGLLSCDAPTAASASCSFDYDPRRPVPTLGGTIASGEPVMEPGAFDQREAPRFFGCETPGRDLSERLDVVSFSTAPLESDMEVIGPIRVQLWVASNCPDTDFTAKLIDAHPPNADYPQGFAMNLTDGILRMRYRNSWSHEEMMEPGAVYEIEIRPFPTANRFCRGHRIRLDISSSNYPHFDLNPNTGEPEGRWRSTRVAHNEVFCDAARPSRIILPIAPIRQGD